MKLALIRYGTRLSQMILDKKLHGVLDQQKGILLIYTESVADVSLMVIGSQ